jgi:signal peptidase I
MSQPRKSEGSVEFFKTVGLALLITIIFRTFLFEPFSIPSGSMIPTLLVGDYLFVSKFAYGYSRYSFPFGLAIFSGRVLYDEPKQGDVVVFKLPADNATDYIKRVVGLPGDRIQMTSGQLYINEKLVKREKVGEYIVETSYGTLQRYQRYLETLPNGRQHYIIELSDQGPLDNTPVYTVPDGHVFVMGDNRDSSQDSRVLGQVGYIPVNNLVGKAKFIFFSTLGSLWKIWTWPTTIRFSRMFTGIQ